MPGAGPSMARLITAGPVPTVTAGRVASDVVGLARSPGRRTGACGRYVDGRYDRANDRRRGFRARRNVELRYFPARGAPRVGRPALSTQLRLASRPPRTPAEAVDRHLALMRHIAGQSCASMMAAAVGLRQRSWTEPAARRQRRRGCVGKSTRNDGVWRPTAELRRIRIHPGDSR